MAGSTKITIKVFYTWGQAKGKVFDPGFGKEREWDIPLLDGYEYEFVENVSKQPGSHHYRGIINPTLISQLEAYDPDALLVFGWSFHSHLKVMRFFHAKKPVYFRGDSTLLDEKKEVTYKKILRRFFLKWVYKHVDYALYAGTANKKYFLELGIKPSQLIFAPHAVNNEIFFDSNLEYTKRASVWRNELGIEEYETVFLFAGKLEPKKDPLLLLHTFMQMPGAECKLIFTGNGILEDELKEKAQHDKRVIFLPFQNQTQMPVVYRLANVFVLPSKGPGETWGLAINEAMACGRAIIASNKCGCADDLISNGKNGFVFEAGNQNDLMKKLVYFKNNPQAGISFGKQSILQITNWNYQKTAEAVEQLTVKDL